MDFHAKKNKVLTTMEQCSKSPLKRVHFAWALPIPENITPQPFFRITFKQSGSMVLKAAFDGEIATRSILSNEAVFFRLYGWDDVAYSSSKEFLAIVYRPDFIRVVVDNKYIIMHNPHSLSSAGLHALQLLDALAQEKTADQQLCCDTAKLLLDITRRDFALPIKDTNRAFDTFLKIKHFVSKNYDQSVNRDSTADYFNISSGYISQLFKRYSSSSFSTYLNHLKLNKVEYLLLNTDYPLAQIASLCGFSCDVRLIKTFRKYYGTSPSRFRLARKHRNRLVNDTNKGH